jgi:peptidoglycan hydrolase-like protein with peptidoglycan-binding domain
VTETTSSDLEGVGTESPDDTREQTAQRPRLWAWAALVAVLAVVTFVGFSILGGSQEEEAVGDDFNTAEVTIRDLADESIYEATLGRPVAGQLTAGISGTVTWVPEPGTVVNSGETLFAVDDRPVVLVEGDVPSYRAFQLGEETLIFSAGAIGVLTWLPEVGTILESGDVVARVNDSPVVLVEGAFPMYRTLREGVEGQDVQQLEQALVSLGFDPDGSVAIDEEFTSATENMVEVWQEFLGVEETGRVSVGEIVFAPVPAQVLSHQAAIGASVNSGTAVVTASGGAPQSGSDVLQLEEALVAIGYDPGRVDGVYDAATAMAVMAWTGDVGHGDHGLLAAGSFLFNPGSLRTVEVFADVGSAVNASSPVISAADLETIVRLDLPAEDQNLLAVGSSVVIVMPDRSETTGTVTFVSRVGTGGGPGSQATFAVEIALDDPSVVEGLDEAPVDVRVVSEAVEDVLALPVSALLALAEGGYAVEVVDSDGTRLVAIDPGFFADGWVEITGNVQPGDIVVVP